MDTLTIELPEGVKAKIDKHLKLGEFANANEYVLSLLQRDFELAEVDRLLGEAGQLTGNPAPLKRLRTLPHAFRVFHQYVIRAQSRDDLRRFLTDRGIATEIYYPIPLHLQPVFTYLGYKEGDLPESEQAAKEVLALPMFPELTEEEQQQVVAGILQFGDDV